MEKSTKNILITSAILSSIVSILVLVNTNTNTNAQKEKINTSQRMIKIYVVAFILCAIVLYIMQDNDSNSMMTNIIKTDPDF